VRVLHAGPRRALCVLSAAFLASCTSERLTQPSNDPPTLPAGLAAVRLHVDVRSGTVTTLDHPAAAASAGQRPSLDLLGKNEFEVQSSGGVVTQVGKKVRFSFQLALVNHLSVDLLAPTFPTPPAGSHSLMLFPFAITVTAGSGDITPSVDWNGDGTPGSGAPWNFFNDTNCPSGGRTDCYRWEGYPAPLVQGGRTEPKTIGFDLDPTVQAFDLYLVLAADLQQPSITGTVTSPQRGPLANVTVTATANPGGQSWTATTNASTGGYSFSGLAPGSYIVSLSGLPAYCFPVNTQFATVGTTNAPIVNFFVPCPSIAYTSDFSGHSEIWRMNADGSGQTQLTSSNTCANSNPTWSPDGKKIAFECFVSGSTTIDIYVMNADGSSPVNITNGSTQNQEPDWGPDGRIVFSSHRDGNDELYVMNADGTNPVRLTTTPDSAEFFPSWSPTGSQITFSKMPYKIEDGQVVPSGNDDIWRMDANGSNFVKLYATPAATDRDPAWQPNGNLIAFWSTNTGCCPSGEAIFTVDAVSQAVTQLTNPNDPKDDPPVFDPEWSGDGSRLAVAGLAGVATGIDIFVIKPDGTGLTDLTNHEGRESFPAWQP
jgi:Tol biopolymer transport system component